MKIGIFDSGLGGLFLMKPIVEALPAYDYVYLGDTAHVPYGDRPREEVYEFTRHAVEYLLAHDCKLVLLLCNTTSAEALRKIQSLGYKALGVIIPTVEEAVRNGTRIGVLATSGTVASKTYIKEIKKLRPDAEVFQQATPKLVPMIETGIYNMSSYDNILYTYLDPLLAHNIDTLILGCTHYVVLKNQIRTMVRALAPYRTEGSGIGVISQDELIADKVRDYLTRHPEIESLLSKNGTRQYLVTKLTPNFADAHHPGFENFGDFDRPVFRLVVL